MVKFVPRVVFARTLFFLLVLPTGNFSFYFEFILFWVYLYHSYPKQSLNI